MKGFKITDMLTQYLWIAGSVVFFLLGYMHLSYGFWCSKNLVSKNKKDAGSNNTFNDQLNTFIIVKPGLGISTKHSVMATYFGFLNIILAGGYFTILQNSYLLIGSSIAISLFFLGLAKLCLHSLLRFGILFANGCFLTSAGLMVFNK